MQGGVTYAIFSHFVASAFFASSGISLQQNAKIGWMLSRMDVTVVWAFRMMIYVINLPPPSAAAAAALLQQVLFLCVCAKRFPHHLYRV